MAQLWQPKGATETVERRWKIDLDEFDGISTVAAVGTNVTASADYEYDDAVITLSGGAAGTDATVLVTVTTHGGLVHVETFHLPIRASTALRTSITVLDICTFALRKIIGDGETPNSDQSTIAVEYLIEMLTDWRFSGYDVGISGTLATTDTLDIPDDYIPAIKWNLRKIMHGHYAEALPAFDAQMADKTERAVMAKFLPGNLDMPKNLATRGDDVWTLWQ